MDKLGEILVHENVISSYIGHAVNETSGIVGTCTLSLKDGFYKLLKKENITDGINIKIKNNEVIVDVHIITIYGIPILNITDNLLKTIKYYMNHYVGLYKYTINIFVEKLKFVEK